MGQFFKNNLVFSIIESEPDPDPFFHEVDQGSGSPSSEFRSTSLEQLVTLLPPLGGDRGTSTSPTLSPAESTTRSDDCLVDRLVVRLVDRLVDLLIERFIGWLIGLLAGRLVC